MSFKIAVERTPSIADGYENGLRAMGIHSLSVKPTITRNCDGSVNIDECMRQADPNGSRWDYVIGYEGQVYFVEVHPASGQVSDMIAKANWLRTWLKTLAPEIALLHHIGSFHWIPTGTVKIIDKDRFRLAQNKIVIQKILLLPQ